MVMVAQPSPALPGALLDALLHRAPLDALLFDTELVCRYAAPAGDTLLGRSRAALVGATAEQLFGREHGDLLAALRRVVTEAAAFRDPAYRAAAAAASSDEHGTLGCWSVEIEPLTLHDYRGREEFRGALVTLADVRDLADERDRLRHAEERLTGEVVELRLQLDARRALAEAARARVRTQLTPVQGYLQVLARRPALLAADDPAVLLERLLPRLAEIVAAVDEAAR
jgi:hypothetical protein